MFENRTAKSTQGIISVRNGPQEELLGNVGVFWTDGERCRIIVEWDLFSKGNVPQSKIFGDGFTVSVGGNPDLKTGNFITYAQVEVYPEPKDY